MPRSAKNASNPFKAMIRESGQARTSVDKPMEADERQPGRRNREGYIQVGAYIPKALYRETQKRLLDEDRNFSELVEQLLADYLQSQTRKAS